MENNRYFILILIIFSIHISCCCKTYSQPTSCTIPIKIDIIDDDEFYTAYEYIDQVGFDTIIRYVKSLRYEKSTIILLNDCMGELSFKQYKTQTNVLLCEGSYINCPDTLVKLVGIFEPTPPFKVNYESMKYFEALRNGRWKFYSESGKLIEERIYDSGWLEDLIKH